MSETPSKKEQITAFENAYGYDCSYLYDLLERSPAAFDAFEAARPMTSFREELPHDAYYVAAISVMQVEDCGACLQLNLKMAIESGVSRELLRTLLDSPDQLPSELRDVRAHALSVARGESPNAETAVRIESRFGNAAFAELALCIAGVGIYPRLKRALLKETECSIASVDV